ncbi:hypothetical protein RvY_13743 [Ramazzottius varieornatus]|uniref:PNPLA domain-containing protein n=1 Tax=Ramazzottius varieornatus TaxID=947166 RepID=A0A1D1VXG3_RAMVA|nr:hypothetical protein RvY_13743 [Ramazzottius varieornatus]
MRQRGAGIILAVDVGGEASHQTYHFGDDFNGWISLKQRFWPWGEPLKVPDITEIQSRLAYVRSISILAALKQSRWCNYIRPAIATFQTLEFHSYDEIVDIGYYFGKQTFTPRGPLRLKLVEMRRQLLTTSFGLFIAHRRPQPVLGAYLNDLASYAKIPSSDGETSEEKRRFRSGTLTERNSSLPDPEMLDRPRSSDVIGLKPSHSFWDDVQVTESQARTAVQAIPMRLSRMNPESFLSVPKKTP